MQNTTSLDPKLKRASLKTEWIFYFEAVNPNSPCITEAKDAIKAAQPLKSSEQNVATVVLIFKDKTKITNTKVSSHEKDKEGNKICSGHSERIALKNAINEAIEKKFQEFAGFNKIADDFNKKSMQEQISIFMKFKSCLEKLELIKIYTEREPCNAASDSCNNFFSRVFDKSIKHIFYYSIPNMDDRTMNNDLLTQREDAIEFLNSNKIDEYLEVNYKKNIDNNAHKTEKEQQISQYKKLLDKRLNKKSLATNYSRLKTEQKKIDLDNKHITIFDKNTKLFNLCNQIEEYEYKYCQMQLEALSAKKLNLLNKSDEKYNSDLSELNLEISKYEKKLIKLELSQLKYHIITLKRHYKMIERELNEKRELNEEKSAKIKELNKNIDKLEATIEHNLTKKEENLKNEKPNQHQDRRFNDVIIRYKNILETSKAELKIVEAQESADKLKIVEAQEKEYRSTLKKFELVIKTETEKRRTLKEKLKSSSLLSSAATVAKTFDSTTYTTTKGDSDTKIKRRESPIDLTRTYTTSLFAPESIQNNNMASSPTIQSNTKSDNPKDKLILNDSSTKVEPIKLASTNKDTVSELEHSAEKESNIYSGKHKSKGRTPTKSSTPEKSKDVKQEATTLSSEVPPSTQNIDTTMSFQDKANKQPSLFEKKSKGGSPDSNLQTPSREKPPRTPKTTPEGAPDKKSEGKKVHKLVLLKLLIQLHYLIQRVYRLVIWPPLISSSQILKPIIQKPN